MTEPVRPLEALIAEMRAKAQQPDDRSGGAIWDWRADEWADELEAFLQAAAPPAPTAEPDEHRRLKYSQMDLDAQTKPLHVEIERLKVEHTRAILHYTMKGYTAGENTDAKHWRLRAEEAESKLAAAPPERVSEGKEDYLRPMTIMDDMLRERLKDPAFRGRFNAFRKECGLEPLPAVEPREEPR